LIYSRQSIPSSLAPFFQEYDIATLDVEKDAFTITERILQFGSRSELRWLFTVYPRQQITGWVTRFGKDRLPEPHRTFWKIILEIDE
jgi:hypothetical protein